MDNLSKEIDSTDIGEKKSGPRHLKFYIQYEKENIQDASKDIKTYEESIVMFKRLLLGNSSDMDMVKDLKQCIANDEKEIEYRKRIISDSQNKIKSYEDCEKGYIEDAKRGLYYDKDCGDIINEEPLTVPPDNAYIPNGVDRRL